MTLLKFTPIPKVVDTTLIYIILQTKQIIVIMELYDCNRLQNEAYDEWNVRSYKTYTHHLPWHAFMVVVIVVVAVVVFFFTNLRVT